MRLRRLGGENDRSWSGEDNIRIAMESGGLQALQLLISASVRPRLSTLALPVVQLNETKLEHILQPRRDKLQMLHATAAAPATLIITPTRDATVAGRALWKAYENVGYRLNMDQEVST